MEKSIVRDIGATCAIGLVAILIVDAVTPANAGWLKSVNSAGSGVVKVSITNATSHAYVSTTSPNGSFPCAAINPLPTYICATKTTWPNTGSYVQYQALAQGNYSVQWVATGGDVDGDEDLVVTPVSSCAGATANLLVTSTGPTSANIQIQTELDAGTAIEVIGLDYHGANPSPNPEEAKTFGEEKIKIKLVGPFSSSDGCITLPVTGLTGDLVLVAQGAAASLPFTFNCPTAPVVVDCNHVLTDESFLQYVAGGVPPYRLTFTPALDQLPDSGDPTVTVVAIDSNGCSTAPCTFTLDRAAASTFSGFDAPIKGMGGTCSSPFATIKRGSVLPIKFTVICNGSPIEVSPHIVVRDVTGCPASPAVLSTGDAVRETSSVWHFNVDTTLVVFQNKTIEITVYLPGGYTKKVVVKLKG